MDLLGSAKVPSPDTTSLCDLRAAYSVSSTAYAMSSTLLEQPTAEILSLIHISEPTRPRLI
eukprot:2766288-Rhodomonas_salina.2